MEIEAATSDLWIDTEVDTSVTIQIGSGMARRVALRLTADPRHGCGRRRGLADDGVERLQPPRSAGGGDPRARAGRRPRLGYAGPDPAAASLRLGRTGTVGVVLTERLPYAFTDPGLIEILHGIATELSAAGNALLLVPAYGADRG